MFRVFQTTAKICKAMDFWLAYKMEKAWHRSLVSEQRERRRSLCMARAMEALVTFRMEQAANRGRTAIVRAAVAVRLLQTGWGWWREHCADAKVTVACATMP